MAMKYRPLEIGEKIQLGDQCSDDGISWRKSHGGRQVIGDPDICMPPFYRRPLKKGERWPTSANTTSTKCPHRGGVISVAVTSCVV